MATFVEEATIMGETIHMTRILCTRIGITFLVDNGQEDIDLFGT